MVLLEGNPLEDLNNAQKIVGVMVGEKWLSWAVIDARLEEIALNYSRD